MSIIVQNCGWQFKFQCPRTRELLQETDDPAVRVCDACLKDVYRYDSDAEIQHHAKLRHCVAVRIPDIDGSEVGEFLGEVSES